MPKELPPHLEYCKQRGEDDKRGREYPSRLPVDSPRGFEPVVEGQPRDDHHLNEREKDKHRREQDKWHIAELPGLFSWCDGLEGITEADFIEGRAAGGSAPDDEVAEAELSPVLA